jgi:hypothetical protein
MSFCRFSSAPGSTRETVVIDGYLVVPLPRLDTELEVSLPLRADIDYSPGALHAPVPPQLLPARQRQRHAEGQERLEAAGRAIDEPHRLIDHQPVHQPKGIRHGLDVPDRQQLIGRRRLRAR